MTVGGYASQSLAGVPLADLRRRLQAFSKLDLLTSTDEQVYERVKLIFDRFPILMDKIDLRGVFRARHNEVAGKDFANADELWYPPPELVRKHGRLNHAGTSIFYCAEDMRVALYEMRYGPGQRYTVLLSKPIDKPLLSLQIAFVGASRESDPHLAAEFSSVRHRERLRALLGTQSNFRKYQMIDDWLTRLITRRVPQDALHLYRSTAAVGRMLFSAPQSTLQGIMYPSVETELKGLNLAMRPDLVDRALRPATAWVVEFGEGYETVPGVMKPILRITPVKRSWPIQSDHSLRWREESRGSANRAFENLLSGGDGEV